MTTESHSSFEASPEWTDLVSAGAVAPVTDGVLTSALDAVREAVRNDHPPLATRRLRYLRPFALVAGVGAAATLVAFLAVPRPSTPPLPALTAPAHGTGPGATSTSTAPRTRTGALAGAGSALCVKSYNPTTLRERAFAFDGVVERIVAPDIIPPSSPGDPPYDAVTFRVSEWFRGMGDGTVTIALLQPASEEAPPSYQVGTRLLVTGEPRFGGPPLRDPVGWTCGFTRYYDPQTASLWHRVFDTPQP